MQKNAPPYGKPKRPSVVAIRSIILIAVLAVHGGILGADPAAAKPEVDMMRYGLCLHYVIEIFAKPGEQGQIPAERFTPVSINVKTWARTAKEAGMTYAILTAKHTSGFALWDSPDYDYDVGSSPFKGDIIADFIAACEAEGIWPGVNYSLLDSYNEGVIRREGPVAAPYFAVIKKHLTELHSRYRGLRVQRFFGAQRLSTAQWDEISALVHRLNPLCVILDPQRQPQHTIATVIKSWWWQPQPQLIPASEVFKKYIEAESVGQTFLLNAGPDSSGRIPDAQIAILKEMKRLIGQHRTQPTDQPVAKLPVAERLKQVKELLKQNLISKEDYDKKVKEIMDSL